MDTPAFNKLRGVENAHRVDHSLYGKAGDKRKRAAAAAAGDDDEDFGGPSSSGAAAAAAPDGGAGDGAAKSEKKKGKGAGGGPGGAENYYRVTCKDNGCGMPHDKVPDMLGRVLAGSKYGVRQTRGKFGLGAKMALIWAKKSTGLPIEVTTAHSPGAKGKGAAAGAAGGVPGVPVAPTPPPKVTHCKLDIDIHRNEPHILEHRQSDNEDGFVGTRISVVISGAWSSYRARVMQYFQQLAVITPYAQFTLQYANISEGWWRSLSCCSVLVF
jgi:hypothetical protein